MTLSIPVVPADVERLIDEYLRAAIDDAAMLDLVRNHRALPIWQDFGGALLLTPAGAILGTDWERPGFIELLTDVRPHRELLHAARGWASRTYTDLPGLVPVRPTSAVACTTCDGTGHIRQLGGEYLNIRCGCGGLGWLPEAPEGVADPPVSRWQRARAKAEQLTGRLLVWWTRL